MTASIGKITTANKGYHLSEITDAVDSYYLSDRPVRAIGTLPPTLGLGPEVTSEQVLNVLSGMTPDGTSKLRERQVKTLGFDLAMSARKEISILHALGNEHMRVQIEAAHRAATDASLAYLESAATFVRRGAGGADVLPGEGLVAFAVTHTDSRNLDPQLHEHVLIANVTKGPDGRWTALDGREIYQHAKTAGFIYQTVMRGELTERLGLVWGDVHHGSAPVAGFDPHLVREFSTRRRGIEDALDRNGLASPKAAAIATLTTRQAKQHDVDLYDLQQSWTDRAAPYMTALRSIPHHPRPVTINLPDATIAATVTEQHATFDRRALIEAICSSMPDGAGSTTLRAPPSASSTRVKPSS